MVIQRPAHLNRRHLPSQHRQQIDRIETAGTRNTYGEWQPTETTTTIDCITAPPSQRDARVRQLTEGGIQLDAMRIFWTLEPLTPVSADSAGDLLVYDNERWRVESTENWGADGSETIAIRLEQQTEIPEPSELSPLDRLARTVRGFVADGSGLMSSLVIPGDERSPRPTVSYASLLLVDDNDRGGYPVHRHNADGDAVLSSSQRTAIWSLQFYRAGSYAYAQTFAQWVAGPEGLDAAEQHNFRVQRPINIEQVDLAVSDMFDKRAFINLSIDYSDTRTYYPGIIETVDGSLAVETGTVTIQEQL